MTIESPSEILLPFDHRPKNPRAERVSLIVLCGLFTVAVIVASLIAYMAVGGHWIRLLVPTAMLACWWLGTWALLGYYRRSVAVWWVDFDFIERTIGETSTRVEFDRVSCLRVRPKSVGLESATDGWLRLPKPVAEALRQTELVDTLRATIDPTIRSEGAWCVVSRPWLGVCYIAGGLVLIGASFSSFFNIGQAVTMIGDGRRFFGRGLVLTRSGIKTSLHDFTTIAWTDIEEAEITADGLALKTAVGRTLRVSPYADNYVPLVAYIEGRLSDPGQESPSAELWPAFSE